MMNSKVKIGLINPKTVENVGSVQRAAGCYQSNQIYFTGDRYERAVKFCTNTHNSTIPLIRVEHILDESEQCKLIAIELVDGATPLPAFKHPDNAMYIFGSEDSTIEQSIIDKCDYVVYIPTIGCMNLAATVNVVLYDRLAKSTASKGDNDLIIKHRDKNNRVKVK